MVRVFNGVFMLVRVAHLYNFLGFLPVTFYQERSFAPEIRPGFFLCRRVYPGVWALSIILFDSHTMFFILNAHGRQLVMVLRAYHLALFIIRIKSGYRFF